MGAQARYAYALQADHALVRRSLALRSSLICSRHRDLHGERLPAKAAAATHSGQQFNMRHAASLC